MESAPRFSRELLYPRYWLSWLGIGLLYVMTLLPWSLLHLLGRLMGRMAMPFMKRRVGIARRNLALCFPGMSIASREKLLKSNFESVGIGVFETGMAWFWPDWRVRRLFKITGYEHIQSVRDKGKGVLLIGLHFLTLELGARMMGLLNQGVGVYRPNDNKVLDWLQTKGRTRSNKGMLDRKNLRGMIRALKEGEMLWYSPDHDYGPRSSVFAPFFAVKSAATTKGIHMLMHSANPAIIAFVPRRLPGCKGYELVIMPESRDISIDNEVATATYVNQLVEKAILMAPEQYMWLHRRFKTRPKGEASFY